jgi:uncharacterized membrane protein
MVAGGALRIIGINEGLWFDEITTLVNYVRLPADEIIESYRSRNNHVLYSLIAHYSVSWFGESPWALRLPAALFGIATIPAAYYLGRQLASRNEAFLVGAFLAFSYHHVWFSQNGRGYTGVLLGSVLLSSCFIRLLTMDKPGYRPVLAYAIIAALTSWIHLTAALVVIAHGIIWLAVISPPARKEKAGLKVAAAAALLLAGLFSLALYAPILTFLAESFSVRDVSLDDGIVWNTSGWVLAEFRNAAHSAVPGGWPIIILGALAIIAGVWAYLKQGLMPAAILILPVLVNLFFVDRYSQVFFPRFLFGSAVFFLLVAVRGGFVLSRAVLPMLNARQVTIIGLAIALTTATRVPGAWKPKQDFIAAAEFIRSNRVAGDAVVCFTQTYRPLHTYLGLDCRRPVNMNELNELEKAHSRTWFLYTFPVPFQGRFPDVWDKVQKEYNHVGKFSSTVGGGDIIIMLKSTNPTRKGNNKLPY